ncbi:MAG: carboxypeptidase [Acidobacteria bacterium]|nr:MAG: carboxypeptidase [Acidobacteriota bacterium]
MERLLQHCESHVDEIVETIEALVRLESPSTDKAAVDRCGAEIAERLRRAGADVELLRREERGDHILARIPGSGRPVLLLGHFDTVWPVGALGRMALRRDGTRLHGPGTFDMKAGIAIALGAIAALRATGTEHPPISMLWTTDEEIGSGTSREPIESIARGAAAVLVLEPALPGGALKTARKGCGEFELTVQGIAAHAGVDPGKGASAIHELAAQVARIQRFEDLDRGVSVNVGIIEGGSRPNVVAEHARAVVDVRAPTMTDARRVEAEFQRLQPVGRGTRLNIRGGFERPPLERTAAVAHLFSVARGVASLLGRDLQEGSTGGGSDGNFTGALGVPTIDGLGPVGDGAHAAHEYVDVAELPWRAALVAGLLNRLTS